MPARLVIAQVLTITVLAALAPNAAAATRYVTPGGSLSDPNCDAILPCNIEQAINTVAQNGDEVVIAPGGYTIASPLTWPGKALSIHGQDGQPRPNIIAPVTVLSVQTGTGSTVRHLRVECTSAQSTAYVSSSTAVELSDLVVVNSVGSGSTGTAIAVGVTTAASTLIRDSVLVATGPNSRALLVGGVNGDPVVTAINVTAYAGAPPNSSAIMVFASDSGGSHPASLTAKNTIARGTLSDITVTSLGAGTVPATANVSSSNYRPASVVTGGSGATLIDGGGNQSADPLFANSAAEDFHQLTGSPTIDAGTTDPQIGGVDIDGNARVLGAAPDIGADEFVASPPAASPPAVTLTGSKRQRVLKRKGLVVQATCDQACAAVVSARVSVPGAAKTIKFRQVAKTFAGGQSYKLKLKLTRAGLRAIRRALRRRSRLNAKASLAATSYGLTSTAKLTIRLLR